MTKTKWKEISKNFERESSENIHEECQTWGKEREREKEGKEEFTGH